MPFPPSAKLSHPLFSSLCSFQTPLEVRHRLMLQPFAKGHAGLLHVMVRNLLDIPARLAACEVTMGGVEDEGPGGGGSSGNGELVVVLGEGGARVPGRPMLQGGAEHALVCPVSIGLEPALERVSAGQRPRLGVSHLPARAEVELVFPSESGEDRDAGMDATAAQPGGSVVRLRLPFELHLPRLWLEAEIVPAEDSRPEPTVGQLCTFRLYLRLRRLGDGGGAAASSPAWSSLHAVCSSAGANVVDLDACDPPGPGGAPSDRAEHAPVLQLQYSVMADAQDWLVAGRTGSRVPVALGGGESGGSLPAFAGTLQLLPTHSGLLRLPTIFASLLGSPAELQGLLGRGEALSGASGDGDGDGDGGSGDGGEAVESPSSGAVAEPVLSLAGSVALRPGSVAVSRVDGKAQGSLELHVEDLSSAAQLRVRPDISHDRVHAALSLI